MLTPLKRAYQTIWLWQIQIFLQMSPVLLIAKSLRMSQPWNRQNREREREDEDVVSFERSLEGPDMMHIIHNATNNLGDVLTCYDPMMASLKALCSLISGRESKQQLIETCFNSGPAIAFQDMVSSFDIGVHEKRWNTIASAIEEINELGPALRTHWNLARFLGEVPGLCEDEAIPAERPAADNSEAFGVALRTVDEAICSDKFWASIKVMLPIAMVQREAVRWVNSCSCHFDLEKEMRSLEEPPDGWRDFVHGCPLRGRRCAELAAGDFFKLLHVLFDASAARLEYELPKGLSQEDVALFIKDFHLARQHLLTIYVVKLSFWTEAPHALAGIAHWDPKVRVKCLQKCLESQPNHPKIAELREHTFAVHELLESGGLWSDSHVLDPLRRLAGEFRLMFTSAWRVEGQHARTKKAAQHAPNHSAAYTSLMHRLPEIKQHFKSNPEAVAELAALMETVPNGRVAAQALGFSQGLLLNCGWISPRTFEKKKAGFNVIYHDDPYCKYTLELPSDIQQRTTAQRPFLAASRDPAEAAELHMQEGSLLLRRALALQDVRKGFKRGMYFTCMIKMASLQTLQALLSPAPKPRQGNAASSVEGFLTWQAGEADASCEASASVDPSLVLKFDQTGDLAKLASESEPSSEDVFAVASILHEQPSRFHRTHVEGEASLTGVWLIQFHTVVKLDPSKKNMAVSLSAVDFNLAGEVSEASPLTFDTQQLSLRELCALKVWEADDTALVHRFTPDCLTSMSASLLERVPKVIQHLMTSPEGFAITGDADTEMLELLDVMAGENLIAGPPWKFTERGLQHLLQCTSLHSGRVFLEMSDAPVSERSTYQLILALDALGWSHEAVTSQKHKHLKRKKHTHRADDDQLCWFTEEGRVSVSWFYLLALIRLGDGGSSPDEPGDAQVDVKEVPYGASDAIYKKLLGMEGAGAGGKRQYQRKVKFGHLPDDVWPDDEALQQAKRKKRPKGQAKKPAKKKTKQNQPPVEQEYCDDGSHLVGSEAEDSLSISISSDDSAPEVSAGQVGEPGEHPPPLPPPDGPPPSPSNSDSDSSQSDSESTTSSSQSDSSSSASSTSQEGGQAAGSAARPEPEEERPAHEPHAPERGARTVRRDRGFKWGGHYITPVGEDDDPQHYQITCGFTSHNVGGKCTKKRSIKFGGKDKVLLCLKYWASLGSACPDATSHWNLWNETVMPAWKNDSLPRLEDISSDAF
eukprot:s111_g36.t1